MPSQPEPNLADLNLADQTLVLAVFSPVTRKSRVSGTPALRFLTGNAARAQNGPAATGKLDYSIVPSGNGSNKTIWG